MLLAALDERLIEHVLNSAQKGLGPVEDGRPPIQ